MKIDCGIIDISISNKKNILQACKKVGIEAKLIEDPKNIENYNSIIFPGNGSFSEAMKILQQKDYIENIKNHIFNGKIFLGICLGMQILFEKSNERGIVTKGMGLLDGEVKEFKKEEYEKVKVPVIGWLPFNKKKNIYIDKKFLTRFDDNTPMYFNNSCSVKTNNKKYNVYYTQYNELDFCSAITYQNVILTQFHPELSSKNGLKIFEFLKDKI